MELHTPTPVFHTDYIFIHAEARRHLEGWEIILELWSFLEVKELSGQGPLFSVPSVPLCEIFSLCAPSLPWGGTEGGPPQ